MDEEMEIVVFCSNCHLRLFSKITAASGKLRIKCPRCKEIIDIDLSLRLSRHPAYKSKNYRAG